MSQIRMEFVTIFVGDAHWASRDGLGRLVGLFQFIWGRE